MLKKILPALIVGTILAPMYVQLFSLYNNNILKIIVTLLYCILISGMTFVSVHRNNNKKD